MAEKLDFLLRISERVHVPPSVVQSVLNVAIDEMSWDEVHAHNREFKRGQAINEDAGGFMLRCLGVLIGAKPRDDLLPYKSAVLAMVETAKGEYPEKHCSSLTRRKKPCKSPIHKDGLCFMHFWKAQNP